MDDERLKRVLTRYARQEIPEKMDIRDKVYAQLNADPRPRRTWGAQPLWRKLAVAAALVLASATAVYALWQFGLRPDPGLQAVQVDNQVVQIGETHGLDVAAPLNSLSVTVDYAYADANRIAVMYHIDGTAEAGTDVQLFSNPTLTDGAGRTYYWLPTSGQEVTTPQSGDSETFTHGGLISFDATGLGDNPGTLSLTLRLDTAYTTAELRASEPFAMLGSGDTSFSFAVPVNPGRTLEVSQAADSNGLTLTLQKVVIAPSLTRLDLCLSDASPFAVDAWTAWEAPVTLDVNGTRVLTDLPSGFAGQNGSPLSPDAACRALGIPDALMQSTGDWSLTLNGFQNRESGQTVGGSWTFAFSVN